MNKNFKKFFLPSIVAINLIAVSLIPNKPAVADGKLLEDIGIGAAAGVVGGAITNNDDVLTNAVNGAAAGAVVNGANRNKADNCENRNLAQDIGVGAAGSTAAGAVTNRDDTVSNAVNGAAAGLAINILQKNCE